ncbi:MAG: type II toxin-antitoxin system PemK/MazF family toxin [Buchananella hordeovulneris]|nr:type II toxin-antitoxin system PemK/MazF family toxin [Buchananella hordeovulneris]
MRRGDLYWVNFEPTQGSEANMRRPAAIVSRNDANFVAQETGRGTVTVVPLTINTKHVAAFQVLVSADESGLRQESKLQAEQVRTVSVSRIGDYIGTLSFQTVLKLNDALRLHLDL